MRAFFRPALAIVGLSTIGLGLAVPLALTLVAQAVLPDQANGSLVRQEGSKREDSVLGSMLVGQSFSTERYFHPRPSATTEPVHGAPGETRPHPYNALASGASNLGPSSAALHALVRARIAALGRPPAPADAVSASASGLDPHISADNARRQVARVAAARGIAPDRLAALVGDLSRGRALGLFGEVAVKVLALNLALDRMTESH